MAKLTALVLPQNANNQSVTLTSSDASTPKLCFTAHVTNDSIVKSIIATSNDTAIVNLQVYVTRSAVDYLLGTVSIPIAAGTTGAVNTMDILGALGGLPVDSMGKPVLVLKAGDTLKVGCLATMTAAKTCTVNIFGQDY